MFQPAPCTLIAILRGLAPAEAPMVGRILFEAGFRILEVPLNRPHALDAMRVLLQAAPEDALIGAGTVLSIEDVEAVRAAGGRLIVSPHCATEVIAHAVQRGMVAVPGVATPTEAYSALQAGAQGLKLFPAEMIPPAALKSIRSILPPGTPLFPVGGIRAQDMAAYSTAGASGFGIGGQLYSPAIAEDALRRAARAFMDARAAILSQ